MNLTLTLMRGDDPQGSPIDSRSFGDRGLTLGRGGECDWVLDDPNRHLSKSHCAIDFEGGEFVVTDTSTNGVFVNSSPERLGRGNTMGLRDGDRIVLGEYLVQVRIDQDDGGEASQSIPDDFGDDFGDDLGNQPPDSSPAGGFPAAEDPFADDADLPGHVQSPDDDPFGAFDLPGPVGADRDDEPFAGLDGPGAAATAPADAIPEDFDIFGDESPGDTFADETAADHVPSEGEFFRPPQALPDPDLGGGAIPDDWESDFDKPLPARTLPPPSRQPSEAPRPQRPPPPRPVAATPVPLPPAPAPSAGEQVPSDVLAAFLAGAGLDAAQIPAAEAEAMMHTVGEAFREMVRGLQETLQARSEIKSEFRLERTMIRPRENNPLKFSPNLEEAMAALLKSGGGGGAYLPPVSAVREGFNDLKAHQMAVMAGMQVALSELLKRFDPDSLERRLKTQSVLDSILPAARKAKYWELYEELYKEIAREAEDDFQGLFGRQFATAYERQVKKL